MTDEQILQNKYRRELAQAVIELLEESVKSLKETHHQQRLLKQVYDWVYERLLVKPAAPKKPIIPMSGAEAKKFEKRFMSFGMYRDAPLDSVPARYMAWFADQPDMEIKGEFKRYLASERGKRRLEEEGETE